MRFSWLPLAVTLLASPVLPALAQQTSAPPTIVEKISLSHAQQERVMRLLTRGFQDTALPSEPAPKPKPIVPSGVTGILGYPLDNSLLVRGTPESLGALKAAVRLVDVPTEQLPDHQVRVALACSPEAALAYSKSVLAIPKEGAVTLKQPGLVLEGKEEWVNRALGQVLAAEVARFKPASAPQK